MFLGLWCSGLILGWLSFPGWGWSEPPASPAPPPASQATSPSKSAEETLWLPLREVIQQYSETTGKRVRLSGRLQTEDKLFDQVYSANDPSWLEDFSRIEIFDEQTGKREIILLGKANGRSPSGPSLKARTPRKLPRKKLSRARPGAPAASGSAAAKQRGDRHFQILKNKFPSIFGQRHKNNKKSPPAKHP